MSGTGSISQSADSDSDASMQTALQNRTNASDNFAKKLNNAKEANKNVDKENVFEPLGNGMAEDTTDDTNSSNVEPQTSAKAIGVTPMDVGDEDAISHVASTSSKISLISTPKEKKEELPSTTLPAELLTLVTSLYLDVTKRMCLQAPFRCATELTFCYNNHYRNEKPDAPYHTQVSNLRCTWQQARYVEFINTAADMCSRAEFPGEGVFTKLIELILSTNYERNKSKSSPRQAYISIVRLFRSLVNAFPPCWLAMRPYYIKFFRQGLDIKKLVLKTKDIITNSNKIVNILFDLIDYTFANYNEMISNSEEMRGKDSSQDSMSESAAMKSQCFSQWNWDELDDCTAFCNIKTDSRLERINVVLGLLLHILETDLCMWILHHHRNPKEFMFDEEKAPLVVLVFEISQAQRSTRLVRRLFEIFSKGIAMGLSTAHLKLMERWVSLVMIASHAADLEDSVIGIRFPALQPKTRELIKDFYRHFKQDNRTCLDTYFTCIDLLRIPYVKYEFIDLFLQMFHHPSNESISPAKVANVIVRKVWHKYKPEAELCLEPQEELSREQYFELLLKALCAYCDMHGLEKLFQHLCSKEEIPALQTVSESVHRHANGGLADNIIMLDEMAKDKATWLQQLRMDVRMSRPKVNLPSAEVICIDKDVIASYRSDLKYCTLLAEIMVKHSHTPGAGGRHVEEWLKFAEKYKL